MAFPELPDDRRARPRRYRGGDAPERTGRRRAPEDPSPAGGEPGADEQQWLLGAALQHGVPARDGAAGEPEGSPRGVRTRHASAPDDDADGARPRGRRYRNGFDELAAGRTGRHGTEPGPAGPARNGVPAPAEGPDSLRARSAARLNPAGTEQPATERPPGRSRPPPGRAHPEQAPDGRRPSAGRPDGTGRHGVRPPAEPGQDLRPRRHGPDDGMPARRIPPPVPGAPSRARGPEGAPHGRPDAADTRALPGPPARGPAAEYTGRPAAPYPGKRPGRAEGTGAYATDRAPRRPDGPPAEGALPPRRPSRPADGPDPRRRRPVAPPPEDLPDTDAADPYPDAGDPRPPRRRPAARVPAAAPADDAAEPEDDGTAVPGADEPAGPRAARRRAPSGLAGRISALTGRGGAAAATAGEERSKPAFWKEILLLAGVAILLTVLIQTFLAKVYVIPSGSMETTLHGCTGCNNDRVLVDKVTYNFTDITPGDIVVFRGTDGWASETYSGEGTENPLLKGLQQVGSLVGIAPPDEKDFVKRVIAVGGQTVSCCDALNQVVVDGQPLTEPYIYYLPEAGPARQIPFGPITVPEGQYWMMGDSRNNSADSRAAGHGPIPESNIIGKVRLIVLPFDRFGWVSAVDPQVTTADAAGAPGLPGGLPLALGIMGTLPLAANRRLTLRARAEAERFLPATRPPRGWRRRS
ncbi:signal peptidase I [Pseudonocardia spirodelae]|uniref:Signal peptidase I n=1 Tax=Pseudonocardia spirodelae TaxID=3133431 RepID=A0ABU8T6C7_9PSEU